MISIEVTKMKNSYEPAKLYDLSLEACFHPGNYNFLTKCIFIFCWAKGKCGIKRITFGNMLLWNSCNVSKYGDIITKNPCMFWLYEISSRYIRQMRAGHLNIQVMMFLLVCLILFNTTFKNISVISWWSVLLVEDQIMLYTSSWSRFELTTSVVIGTDCIGSFKSNYHTITATTAPKNK